MSEIGMLGTSRDDEIVVGNAAAFREHLAARRVDARNLRQNDLGVPLPTQDAADRRRNICRRQARGRDLVEQRLEQVIVVTIDDHDVKRCLRQLLGGRKSTESCSNNHDPRGSGMVGSPPVNNGRPDCENIDWLSNR